MRNPLGKFTGFRSPVKHSNLQNPLTNGEKIKRLKEMHARSLAASGVREPKNPFKK